jgi:hypothetical protein
MASRELHILDDRGHNTLSSHRSSKILYSSGERVGLAVKLVLTFYGRPIYIQGVVSRKDDGMRVLVESERTLVVEEKGRVMLLLSSALVAMHILAYFKVFHDLSAVSHKGTGYVMWGISVCLYIGLLWLSCGPLRDKITVTIHGFKKTVTREHVFPAGLNFRRDIAFKEFDAFEISPPESQGFCRLAMTEGKPLVLFRIGANDDFESVRRLDVITQKNVRTC